MDSSVWLGAMRFLTALLYYILYPIFVLLWGLWTLLGTLLAPVFHLGLAILYVIGAPFRLLAKFEPLYFFLGWAVLIGGATGLLLCIAHRSLGRALNLSRPPRMELPKVKRPPSADWARQMDRKPELVSTGPNGSHSSDYQSDGKTSGRFSLSEFYTDWIDQDNLIPSMDTELISTTIIEEEDDNDTTVLRDYGRWS